MSKLKSSGTFHFQFIECDYNWKEILNIKLCISNVLFLFLIMTNNIHYLVKDTKNTFRKELAKKKAVDAEKTTCTKALRFYIS